MVADGFDSPVDVMQLPGWDLLLVAEKPGRIVAVRDGEVLEPPVLDISDWVSNEWNEQGLLTIEAHPDFEETCELFVFYTDLEGHSNLVSFLVEGPEIPTVSLDSVRTILFVPQKHQYHQSGSMVFGPDGHLWVSIGDGGSGRGSRSSQDLTDIKGSVLRLDLNSRPYAIPSDNPFIDSGDALSEVWAYGLRNPWRISIDQENGNLYLPDTGWNEVEELNVVSLDSGGTNFGWPNMEGDLCSNDLECDASGVSLPIYQYLHDGTGCAIVGGEVYRGVDIPELNGHYFFGDFCRAWIRTLRYHDGKIYDETVWEDLDTGSSLTSFGTDSQGELYFTVLDGQLWKIVPNRD